MRKFLHVFLYLVLYGSILEIWYHLVCVHFSFLSHFTYMDFLYFLVGGLTGIALYIARNYDVIMKRIGTKKHVSTVLDMFLYVSYGLYFAFALGGISSSSLVMTELLVHKPFYVFLLAGICVAYMQKRKKVRGRI